MERWQSSGHLVFAASAAMEAIVVFSIVGVYPLYQSIVIAVVLLTVPSFVVGYLVGGRLGTVYGLVPIATLNSTDRVGRAHVFWSGCAPARNSGFVSRPCCGERRLLASATKHALGY